MIKKRNIYLTLFLGIQMLFMKWIESNPSFIETYYSRGIYPYISSFLRILFGWIPFSFGDLIIIFFCLYLLYIIYKLVSTRFTNMVSKILGITSFISIIYFLFYLSWGLNYFREPLDKNLKFKTTPYNNQELLNLTKYLVSKLNESHLAITKSDSISVIVPHSNKDIYLLAKKGYKKLATNNSIFTYKYGIAKNSLISVFQSYNGTSGYLNPFTGEAQVNRLIPKTILPTTTTHEMAHQIGFAAENEANFIGFLAALFNDDPYFKYSAYRMATRYAIFELYKRDKDAFEVVYKSLNKGILIDFKSTSDFWNTYKNPFEPIVKKGYNVYLKSNNQIKGINSYNYVVDLLISYFKTQHNKL
jgi:hypothetical protein